MVAEQVVRSPKWWHRLRRSFSSSQEVHDKVGAGQIGPALVSQQRHRPAVHRLRNPSVRREHVSRGAHPLVEKLHLCRWNPTGSGGATWPVAPPSSTTPLQLSASHLSGNMSAAEIKTRGVENTFTFCILGRKYFAKRKSTDSTLLVCFKPRKHRNCDLLNDKAIVLPFINNCDRKILTELIRSPTGAFR